MSEFLIFLKKKVFDFFFTNLVVVLQAVQNLYGFYP